MRDSGSWILDPGRWILDLRAKGVWFFLQSGAFPWLDAVVPPCVIFEDEHLLVVHKPAGLNTHAPGPCAGEGIYDWLRHREPRWARLAIVQRLDKETSGVIVFSKTDLANRSLAVQFSARTVRKHYLLVTDRPVKRQEFVARSALVRSGERYVSRPVHAGADPAETRFRRVKSGPEGTVVEARPITGRTHQIRAHAAAEGFPILGDVLYGGTPDRRVHLHAQSITLTHPACGRPVTFEAPADFAEDPRLALRRSLLDPAETDAFRLVHGESDGWLGWYVDRLGDYLLSQSEGPLTDRQKARLRELLGAFSAQGAWHKLLTRQVRRIRPAEASPRLVLGNAAPTEIAVRENGVRFELRLNEGYSVGLFLDQRDNRRRFLTGHVAAGFELGREIVPPRPAAVAGPVPHAVAPAPLPVPSPAGLEILNAFAYTCGFSVCAAMAGARTTSLDISRKYLDWGRRNFEINGLSPADHDFVYGDVFDWLPRLAKKGRRFDVVALDPPTFSQSRESGVFQAEKDYGRLVAAALPVLKPGGVLFASTNASRLTPEAFLDRIQSALDRAGRRVARRHYAPQPPDFPVSPGEPAYLKTVWLQVE